MAREQSKKTAKETTKSNSTSEQQLIEQIPIEETPFTAVRFEEKWFLALGKYRLSDTMDSLEKVREDARDASWIRIMQIMRIMIAEDKTETLNQLMKGEPSKEQLEKTIQRQQTGFEALRKDVELRTTAETTK